MTHLDTTFLVDLLRRRAPALALLEGLRDETLEVSIHVACELRAGADLSKAPKDEHEKVTGILAGVQLLHPDEAFAETYGRVLAELVSRGQSIPTMDLLIATAAVAASAPLVTRNKKDFSRIPGLTVLGY